jgi:hypothetical protein
MNKRLMTLAAAFLLLLAMGCSAGDIVVYSTDNPLTEEELQAALLSDDFNEKNRARGQLDSLVPEKRLELLKKVYESDDSATRTMAVVEIAKLPVELSKPTLEKIAKEDADEDIRDLAAMYLEGDTGDEDDEGEDE